MEEIIAESEKRQALDTQSQSAVKATLHVLANTATTIQIFRFMVRLFVVRADVGGFVVTAEESLESTFMEKSRQLLHISIIRRVNLVCQNRLANEKTVLL